MSKYSGTSNSNQLGNQANSLIMQDMILQSRIFTVYWCVMFVQKSGHLANQECDQTFQSWPRGQPLNADKIAIKFSVGRALYSN